MVVTIQSLIMAGRRWVVINHVRSWEAEMMKVMPAELTRLFLKALNKSLKLDGPVNKQLYQDYVNNRNGGGFGGSRQTAIDAAQNNDGIQQSGDSLEDDPLASEKL